MDKIFEITAKEVTIQVKDERTGEQYSRTLPIVFYIVFITLFKNFTIYPHFSCYNNVKFVQCYF